jgi:amicyanin
MKTRIGRVGWIGIMTLCPDQETHSEPSRRPPRYIPKVLVATTAALGIPALGALSPMAPAAFAAYSNSAASSVVPASPAPAGVLKAPAAASQHVTIAGFKFSPATLTVRVGTTVTWTNSDSAAHNVSGGPLHSPALNHGASYRHTFTKAGTYHYVCTFHPWMKGTVIVK